MQKAENKIRCAGMGRRKIIFSFSISLFVLSLLCLNSCIREKLDDCPQGIHVRFFAKTPCSADTLYPQLFDLRLYTFDQNDKLVAYYEEGDSVALNAAYTKTVPVRNGLFKIVAWGGVENGTVFESNPPEIGVTTRTDLLFRLHQAAQQTVSIDGKRLYCGESPVVYLPDPAVYGSVWANTSVNLQEITNRIAIAVEGLPDPGDYEIVLESANTSMNIDGSIAGNDAVVRYHNADFTFKENVLTGHFTVLKLQSGYDNTLIISDLLNGRELYHDDLVGTILLKNPNVNLACDHDFTILFTIKDQPSDSTYMSADIKVNGWSINSYDSEL